MKTPEMMPNAMPQQPESEKPGVLGYRIENNHYVVNIRWKDGENTESHFPVAGFEVANPATKDHLGSLKGKEALEILQKHAGEYTREEFSWRNFI